MHSKNIVNHIVGYQEKYMIVDPRYVDWNHIVGYQEKNMIVHKADRRYVDCFLEITQITYLYGP